MYRKHWILGGSIVVLGVIIAIVLLTTPKPTQQESGKSDVETEQEMEPAGESADNAETGEKDDGDEEVGEDRNNVSTSDNESRIESDTPVITPSTGTTGTDNSSTTGSTTGSTTDSPSGNETEKEPEGNEMTNSESNTVELPFVPFP